MSAHRKWSTRTIHRTTPTGLRIIAPDYKAAYEREQAARIDAEKWRDYYRDQAGALLMMFGCAVLLHVVLFVVRAG